MFEPIRQIKPLRFGTEEELRDIVAELVLELRARTAPPKQARRTDDEQ